MKHIIIPIITILLLLPAIAAYEDNFFSVSENFGPYEVLPGDDLAIGFTLSNRDMECPRNVTVYLDPCPFGWTCETKVLCFNESDRHPVNLTANIPKDANPGNYVIYIRLQSEWWTTRGDDKVSVKVLSEQDLKTLSYEEYKAKYESGEAAAPVNPAKEVVKPSVLEINADDEDVVEEQDNVDVAEEQEAGPSLPEDVSSVQENRSDLIEGVERLESSSQFVEYASIVLVVVLVFIVVGAYMTFRKDD